MIKTGAPLIVSANHWSFPLKPVVISLLFHTVVATGLVHFSASKPTSSRFEVVIVDLILEERGTSSDNETRSEPKAVAAQLAKTETSEPPVREATETQDFEQVTILPQATVGITEPAPNERITTEVIPEPDLVLSKQGFESNAPAILTTTNSITEPAPAPVPAIAKVKPVSLEKKTQVGPDIHKAKQKPQRKIRAKKTKKKKKRTARPTRKKRRVANNAPSPGRGKKSKGQARKGKTQGVRYTGAGLSNPRPRYPPAAKRKRVQGRVLLAVVVASSGRANSVRIRKSSGHRLLDQAAVKTVKRWRFKPATRNGQPVRARVIVPITFKLKG